jgi:hypothetical protein
MIEWTETAKTPPVVGQVVLGFWPTVHLCTVVRHENGRWNLPGYTMSEYRNPPLYWAEVPELPPGYARGE